MYKQFSDEHRRTVFWNTSTSIAQILQQQGVGG
jgi:hypothetical protein